MLSLQWLNDHELLLLRKGCRTLSRFDVKHLTSTDLATLPNYIDHCVFGTFSFM